ncbi:c-type cytochrome, partial [Kaarinaea lacus]
TQCAMCHGVNGRGNGIPGSSIAGMDIEEFKQCLTDFKNGTRRNEIMRIFVNRLSDQDFENLAAFYATQ